MVKFKNIIGDFLRDEEGAELVEWTVFVAVLVISVVAAIAALRIEIENTWEAIRGVLVSAQNAA
jgi:Flp pilus assembly pilin Flp